MKNYECDGQMSLFDLLPPAQPEKETREKPEQSQPGKDTDVPASVTDKNVGDKHWHRFPKETPPKGVRLEVMYQWTYVQKADRLGVCMADWTGKDFFWHGKPWDIGKVIPIAWRIGVDGYTPINDHPVVLNGKFNNKCLTCNGWHFNSHRESSCPFDDCNEGNGYKDYESLFVNTEKENYNMKGVCKDSGHECNSQELWRVAKEIGVECRNVCCRKCDVRGCGARCNGSSEPPKVRLWHRLCKMKPEESGYYEIMDIDGKKGKAWYEAIRRDFDHVTGRQIECWREN